MIDAYSMGGLPQYNMSGPTGFSGQPMPGGFGLNQQTLGDIQQPQMGGGMFGAQKKKQFNPAMMGMGIIPSLLMQHPGYALPSLFGAAGLGLHALKVF